MSAEITHKSEFRLTSLAVAMLVVFVAGWLFGMRAFGHPDPAVPAPCPPAVEQTH